MRRLGGLIVVLLLAQVGVAVAAPGPGLEMDQRFGRDGVVQIDPHVPGHAESSPAEMVGTGDGGFFVLEGATGVDCKRCRDWYLVRHGRNGARDRSFGFVPVARGLDYFTYLDLAVDAAGRPLVFWKEGADLVVHRFTPRGRADRGFANRGRFVLRCGCFPDSLLALPNQKILLVSDGNERVQRSFKGSIPVLARLRGDGSLDSTFNGDGIARLRLRGRFSPDEFVVEAGGGVVFSGDTCCGMGPGPYVARLREEGRIDRRFGRAARRAVARLPRYAEVLFRHGLVGHRDGSVDLYGGLGFSSRTFVLRLDRNGSLSRSFGRSGMKAFPWSLSSAAPDGHNGAIVLANRRGYGKVFRLGPQVRTRGAPRLPLSTGDAEGVSVEAQHGGTVLVFDFGFDEGCRQTCDSDIEVTRLRLLRLRAERSPRG